MMRNYDFLKGVELVVFPSPIRLYSDDFPGEKCFNKFLKLTKDLKHLRFKLEQIYPCKFAIVVDEGDIILLPSCRCTGRAPNIRINKIQRKNDLLCDEE
jgi:hypothetical protein